MRCVLNNSLSYLPFGGASDNASKGSGQLNVGVVTPPDNLPNASLLSTLNSYETPKPNTVSLGRKSLSAGDISAITAFGAIGLSALSLAAFIFRKH